ncbi:MAG TPA: DUF1330 domain-containing protein [Candidatus Acidoferrales bacterium]|nr:DUF1330 domain-containing protein [Candidatus Acidoferrales bacterium]
MAAYIIADILEILDQAKMNEYRQRVGATIDSYGGRYLVRGGQTRVLEGDWQPRFPVVLEFPSIEQAERWYKSEEYRDVKALRVAGARTNAILVTGLGDSGTGH